jgi:mono/diheme cytochrome c family protein
MRNPSNNLHYLAGAFAGLAVAVLGASPLAAQQPQVAFRIPPATEALLDNYCSSCHGEDSQKGDVRFDQLAALPLGERLALLNRMQEQTFLGHMPPKSRKTQPTAAERNALVQWMNAELRAHNASTLEDKLRLPAYGNYVPHDRLFSGEIKDAPYTPARRWLVSPQIFSQRANDVFGPPGFGRPQQLYGVTNPFVLPDASGVRYYDNESLDGGVLLVMLGNADWISQKQVLGARVKSGEVKAGTLPNPQDRWIPKNYPPAFDAIILKKTAPTDAEIADAVRAQFASVLQRAPDDAELAKYTRLTREAIAIAGNTEGLRQMLLAVLLESEFLYRLEFGAGQPDQHGRKMLAPREGAYAISYALGDRGPDAKLLEAAAQGRLNTREDYKREVLRLLDDKTYYRGEVDPSLSGKNMQAHVASHPRIVRFFRDFFGYPMATKVFKDPERGGGIYQNPERGTAGTPGFLVNEADRVVDLILQKDRDVFATLLTTDEFIVYYNRTPEEGRAIIAEWKKAWDALKDTNWKTEPEKVIAENEALLASFKHLRLPKGDKQKRDFLFHMYFFSDYFGKGITPFTTIATAHGYYYNHSPFYNLPPTPLRGRYTPAENRNFKGLDDAQFWDYPVEQPFKIANRKGILTHPAWLIAHSLNTENDPVRRGRWIREKLLAGRVPDIPITVDAVVPEDPHKTLRERLDKATSAQQCAKCHQYMNPLGLPFELFDDFGRYRTQEPLEHAENIIGKTPGPKTDFPIYKTLPVDPRGVLDSTGVPALDGEVKDAFDLIDRLAKSPRVRQSIIRHAFRFYMGRNEMLSDSRTLIEADQAYVQSGGSFKAVIVSLLTSDSFLYRK